MKKISPTSRLLVLGHAGSDVDAMATAVCLSESLQNRVSIGYCDHLNQNAKAFCDTLRVKTILNPDLDSFDALILVDFNSLSHAGSMALSLRAFKKPVLILDHHEKEKNAVSTPFFVSAPECVSATVVAYRELVKCRFKLSKKAFLAVAVGIFSDTAFLHRANTEAIELLGHCLRESGADYNSLSDFFSVPQDVSERIAVLRASHRMRLLEINGFLVALSQVSFFEAQAAYAQLSLGADASFVAGFEKHSRLTRLNCRASNGFIAKTRVHLGKLVHRLPDFFGGQGNGHAGAAGFNAPHADAEDVLEQCLDLLLAEIKKRSGKLEVKEIF